MTNNNNIILPVTGWGFVVKDSGQRHTFSQGMVRDTEEGKIDYTNLLHGPMLNRWAIHLTKAKEKYPDVQPGIPNWTLAAGEPEMIRFKQSAFRHFMQWMNGEVDEDHASACLFNINGYEYVREKMQGNIPDSRISNTKEGQ